MHQIVAPRDLELYTAPKPTDKRLARTGGRVDKGAKLTIVGASIRQGHKGSAASVSQLPVTDISLRLPFSITFSLARRF